MLMPKKFTNVEAVKHLISSENLLPPGSKFIVTSDLCTAFTKGTEGFMSYVDNLDGGLNTLVRGRAVLVKRGKTGKQRLECVRMILSLTDAHKLAEDEIKRYLIPTSQTKVRYFVQVNQIEPFKYSLMEMPAHDFIGWSLSMANFLHYLTHCFSRRGVSAWPQGDENILGRVRRYILDSFSNNPDNCYEEYATPSAREEIIDSVRKLSVITTLAELSQRNNIIHLKKIALGAVSNIYTVAGKKLFSSTAIESAEKKLNAAQAKNAAKMKNSSAKGKKRPYKTSYISKKGGY